MAGVTYTLVIDGTPASDEVLDAVQSIEVETHHRLADILRLRLTMAPRDDASGWHLADDELFERLTSVQLLVTIGASIPTTLINAHVVEARATFSNVPGGSSYSVVAMDSTVLMNLEEKVRSWPNMPDSAIATLVFGEYGILPIVTNTQPVRQMLDTTVTQRDTDVRFLRYLAQRNGFELYIKPTVVPGVSEGHFHPPMLDLPSQGVLSANMGDLTNVTRLEARYEMLRSAASAAASGVDARTLDDQPVEATRTDLTELGNQTLLNGDRPRRTRLRVTGMAQTGELQTLAQAVADRSAWAVTVSGQLDTAQYGDVLQVAEPVAVRGVGEEFSGMYYVERVLHRFSGDGYDQEFTLRRNALEATGAEIFIRDMGLIS